MTLGKATFGTYWPSVTSSTDYTGDTYLLRVEQDGEMWLVSEDGSALYGAGRSLLEAMTDFWHACLALPDVIDRGGPATKALERQAEVARRLTGVKRT